MANRLDVHAISVKGSDPRHLIEKITREKVYGSVYWKQECFGLTAASIVDKAVALKYVGGSFGGNRQPTPFLCLVLKLLQLQPEKEIILEYIRDDEFKYLRALGAYYLRLTGGIEEVFSELEPLYNDYRKIIVRASTGWKVSHMDEFIDELLVEEYVCDIQLPHIPKRIKLEDEGKLDPRASVLDKDLDWLDESDGSDDQDSGDPSELDEDIEAAKQSEKDSNSTSLQKSDEVSKTSSVKPVSTYNISSSSFVDGSIKPSFIAADKFSGAKLGYVYMTGDSGLGYYSDSTDTKNNGKGVNNNSSSNNTGYSKTRPSSNDSNTNSNSNSNQYDVSDKTTRGLDNRPAWMTAVDVPKKSGGMEEGEIRDSRDKGNRVDYIIEDRKGEDRKSEGFVGRGRSRSRSRSKDGRRRSRDSRDRGSLRRDNNSRDHRNGRDSSRDRGRRHRSRSRSRSRDRDRNRKSSRSRSRSRSPDDRHLSHHNNHRVERRRSRSRSPERDRDREKERDRGKERGRSGHAEDNHSNNYKYGGDSSSKSDKNSKSSSTSKFDKIFGKSKSSAVSESSNSSSSSSRSMGGSSRAIALSNGTMVETNAPEGSVEYWNAIRQGEGLKPLK